jgi:hypothetical protein
MRGTAPGRARPADDRSDSFKPGRQKLGGRKKGTPNVFSIDYKKAILEAAYRVGYDGNGKDGVVGYLRWLTCHSPQVYGAVLLSVLALETVESCAAEEPSTKEENNEEIRKYVGLTAKKRMARRAVQAEPRLEGDWTGEPFPVGSLMQIAVKAPKAFCKLLVAALLRPPTKRRPRPDTPGGTPQQAAA